MKKRKSSILIFQYFLADSSNFTSTTGATAGLTNIPSSHPLSLAPAAPISSKRLSESSASESDSDSSRNGDDTDSESG